MHNRYVGVRPKWVIRRYGLHEAAKRTARGEALDWPNMALEFGHFDQAHFIKDFEAIVSRSPAKYARNIGAEDWRRLGCARRPGAEEDA